MPYWTSHTVRSLKRCLQSLAAALLVLAYVAANVEFEAIHETFHTHDAHVTHTTADEQDPCHVSLYHPSDEKGCHHKAHVSIAKKCPLCHIYHIGDKIFVAVMATDTAAVKNIAAVTCTATSIMQVIHHLPSRAPPAIA